MSTRTSLCCLWACFSLVTTAAVAATSVKQEPTLAKRPRPASALTTESSATPISPETEKLRQHYPDGRIMIEREGIRDAKGNFIQQGKWLMWDLAGTVVVRGECRDNQFHGQWQRTFKQNQAALFSEAPYKDFTGPFLSQANFVDGQLSGRWTIFDIHRAKISEIEFFEGKRQGIATWWYPNGQMMQQVPFSDGSVDGLVRHWTQDGSIDKEERFEMGRRLAIEQVKDKSGNVTAEAEYMYEVITTASADDWWTARLAVFTKPQNRELHGPTKFWYANGQLKAELLYDHGVMHGDQRWWYEDGQLASHGIFLNGKPNDAWDWYHRNGQKAVAGTYDRGAVKGDWTWWTANGTVSHVESADGLTIPSFEVLQADRSAAAPKTVR